MLGIRIYIKTMNYSLNTHNLQVSDIDQDYLEKKLPHLKKHLLTPYHMEVSLTHDRHNKGDVISCHLTVKQAGSTFHAERSGATIQEVIDSTVDAVERELAKAHDKRKDHHA